jgi:ribonuclease P protein component
MLPQKNRLRKKIDFENVYRGGRSFFLGNISLRIVKNNLDFSRIGFVVSAKFSKKATERNKIKRQLRDIFAKKIVQFKEAIDLVVVVKKKEKIEFDDLQKNIEKVLKKARIIE